MNKRMRRISNITRARRRPGAYAVHKEGGQDCPVSAEGAFRHLMGASFDEHTPALFERLDNVMTEYVAANASDGAIRSHAVRRITDPNALRRVASASEQSDTAREALERAATLEEAKGGA